MFFVTKHCNKINFLFFIGIQIIVLNLALQISTVENILISFYCGIDITHLGNHEKNRRDKCRSSFVIQIVFVDNNTGQNRVDDETSQGKITGFLVKTIIK